MSDEQDKEAWRLAFQWFPWCWSVHIKRHCPKGEKREVEHELRINLFMVFRSYDNSLGSPVTRAAYAAYTTKSWLLHRDLPRGKWARLSASWAAERYLRGKLQREPTPEEVADWSGTSAEFVTWYSQAHALGLTDTGDEGRQAEQQEARLYAEKFIEVADDTLTPKEAEILFQRTANGYFLAELGEEYGVSRERIRQIEALALRKVRRAAVVYGIMPVDTSGDGVSVAEPATPSLWERKFAEKKRVRDVEKRLNRWKERT